jgi:aspartyl/asparaginyl beta-hydroxylase (cupin superfamily)
MIRSVCENLIGRTRDGQRAFFDAAAFPWVSKVEAGWKEIRGELDTLLENRAGIPNFQDISEDQKVLTQGDDWKTFFLYAYGHRAPKNCARCPQTDRLLRLIPGMKTAMFSILAPRKHLPEHRGPHKGVLRYHLGLIVPEPDRCRIRVKDETRHWEEGKSLIFDDSHPHEAWNDSDRHRVVLFVDFVRPLPFPLSIYNRLVIERIARTPFIATGVERIRNPEMIAKQ